MGCSRQPLFKLAPGDYYTQKEVRKGFQKAQEIYGIAIHTLVPVSSCRAAEATKLMENIFRCVNIALVNELKVVYGAMGIDIWEVIQAAKTKPFGFMAFYPGPGLGGHCIPIDPFYLTWKAREYGEATRFIELAGEINTKMPEYVVHRVGDALIGGGLPHGDPEQRLPHLDLKIGAYENQPHRMLGRPSRRIEGLGDHRGDARIVSPETSPRGLPSNRISPSHGV